MKRIWTPCLVLLSAALVFAGAPAASASNRGIKDNANFFTEAGRRQGNEIIDEIYKQHKGKEVLVETYDAVPEGSTYAQFVQKRFEDAHLNGVYILVVRQGSHVSVRVDPVTARLFTNSVQTSVAQRLGNKMREMKKPPFDAALIETLQLVADTFKSGEKSSATVAPRSSPGAYPPPSVNRPQGRSGGSWLPSGIMGWVCLGVGVWIVFALLRSVMRRRTGGYGGGPGGYGQMGGGPGYGGGYGGGGYPGGGGYGGGGWGSSLLGGLFGAAAGNWLYDRFARGGGSAYGAPPADTGSYSGGSQPSTPDWAGPGDSAMGGGESGGEASFGGGDAGGGGDFSGGGDFGGGGGDFGGGGGGDFGGGGGDFSGGGDFGGGGGDAGGGGDFA